MSEVKIKRQNFSIMWFDCIQGFDSVTQKWLMYALKLAKTKSEKTKWKNKESMQKNVSHPTGAP